MELERIGTTRTGNLEFKLAAAACYLPVGFLHLVASGIWLATEPREHRFVRFHAVQSLLGFALLFGGSLGSVFVGMIILPILVLVVGGVLGSALGSVSEDLAGLVALICGGISFLSYVLGALIGLRVAFAFTVGFFGT